MVLDKENNALNLGDLVLLALPKLISPPEWFGLVMGLDHVNGLVEVYWFRLKRKETFRATSVTKKIPEILVTNNKTC